LCEVLAHLRQFEEKKEEEAATQQVIYPLTPALSQVERGSRDSLLLPVEGYGMRNGNPGSPFRLHQADRCLLLEEMRFLF
jgi:hypothetical protein